MDIGQAVQITATSVNEVVDKYRTKFCFPSRNLDELVVSVALKLCELSNDPDYPEPKDWFEVAKGLCEETIDTWEA